MLRPFALVCLSIALPCMVGCGLDSNFGDLGEKLLDPEVQALDVPGRRLISGPHYDLSMRLDERGDPHALARNADGELVIVDFASQTHCRAPNVGRYGAPVEGPGGSFIPTLHRDESDALWLGFTSFDCRQPDFQVLVGGLPSSRPRGDLEGSVLVFAPDRTTLLLVDPWEKTTRLVAEEVTGFTRERRSGMYVWYERGTLVASSPQLDELARIGNDVRWWDYSPEGAEFAYLDGETLFRAPVEDPGASEIIATDVCAPRFVSLNGRPHLQFQSPCADGRVVFQDRETGEQRELARGVIGGPVVRTVAGEPYVTYLTYDAEADTGGTLWLARGTEPAEEVAVNAQIRPSAVTAEGALLALADANATGGRLLEWKDGRATTLADDVHDFTSLRMDNGDLTLYASVSEGQGKLVRLRDDHSLQVLHERVLLDSINDQAFVANYDGHVGDLMLIDRATGETRLVASGVLPASFAFSQQFAGIFILADRNLETDTSTLRLELFDSGRHWAVHSGVTETLEVPFPAAGLLYNVVIGDEPGVWFAKAL